MLEMDAVSISLQGLCVTCLASNRKVEPVKNDQKIAIMQYLLESKLQTPLNLCWECGAQLNNICKFQQKAKNSMNVMYAYLKRGLALPKNENQCYSKLNHKENTNISIDSFVNATVEIKLEPLCDDEVSIKMEPNFDSPIESVEPMEFDSSMPQSNIQFGTTPNAGPLYQTNKTALGTKRYSVSDINAKYKSRKTTQKKNRAKSMVNFDGSYLDPNQTTDPDADVVVDIGSGDESELFFQKPFKKISEHSDKFTKIKISKEDLERKRTERRMHPNYISKTYKCETCVLGFATEEHFAFHNDSCHHESRGRFTCAVCARRYRNKKCARCHAARHYHAYQCVLCDQQYESWSKDSFIRHYNEKHGLKGTTCKICNTLFQTIEEVRSHMRDTHYQFKCDCGTSFFSQYNLDRHIMKGCKRLGGGEEDKETYHCAECNKSYENKYYFRAHFTTAKHLTKDAPVYTCDACGKQCSNKKSLAQHIILKHTTEKNFVCGICDERFVTPKELQFHDKLSHGDKINDRVCNICGVQFAQPNMLKRHMVVHSKERPHKCGECAERFASPADLHRHNKIKHKKENLSAATIEITNLKKELKEIKEDAIGVKERALDSKEDAINVKKEKIEILIDI